MALPALLLVFIDPGKQIPLDEFNDWYNDDHIAARTKIPAFQTWTRLEAVDERKPAWGAIYDLTSIADTKTSSYGDVLKNPSEVEKQIIPRIGEVDRRIYELLPRAIPDPSPEWSGEKASPYWSFIMVDIKGEAEEEFNQWYNEEHIPLMAKCPGWLRARRYVLKDWGRFGVDAPKSPSAPPKYLAVYEWASLDMLESDELKTALSTPWAKKLFEHRLSTDKRVYKFYKSFART